MVSKTKMLKVFENLAMLSLRSKSVIIMSICRLHRNKSRLFSSVTYLQDKSGLDTGVILRSFSVNAGPYIGLVARS